MPARSTPKSNPIFLDHAPTELERIVSVHFKCEIRKKHILDPQRSHITQLFHDIFHRAVAISQGCRYTERAFKRTSKGGLHSREEESAGRGPKDIYEAGIFHGAGSDTKIQLPGPARV